MWRGSCKLFNHVEFRWYSNLVRTVLCWYGAGMGYSLMVGRSRVSRTFAAGQRSELGRYDVHWDVFFSGFGMINDDIHIAGLCLD